MPGPYYDIMIYKYILHRFKIKQLHFEVQKIHLQPNIFNETHLYLKRYNDQQVSVQTNTFSIRNRNHHYKHKITKLIIVRLSLWYIELIQFHYFFLET